MKGVYYVTIFCMLIAITCCDNVGWTKYFEENPVEFHNVPLRWEMGDLTNVPLWLSGIYVRNGAAQVQ